ncbi:MAG TPA: hypothetical protein GX729_02995 [Firmicutes bacterium]|nr:hypothetical protein [Bacillota bacterium]
MKRARVSVLALAGTYIGTVVGAGFASGQEVLQFFGMFGPLGIPGVIVAVAGFFLFGFACIEIGRETGASSHKPVFIEATGKALYPLLDLVTAFFLFGALSAMISGTGSILNQEFGLPWIVGASAMAIATFITVLTGLRGITYAIGSVVPFLLAGVFLISAKVILTNGLHMGLPPPDYKPPVGHWAVSAFNYVSYNILMAAPVLSAIGGILDTKKQAFTIAALGALGLGAGLLLVYLTIVSSLPGIAGFEIPLARLASQVWKFGQPLYVTIFAAEVYTTAVANLYGISARLIPPGNRGFMLVAFVTTGVALLAASAGFSNLVRVVYPLSGWAGTVFIGGLAVYLVKAFIQKH